MGTMSGKPRILATEVYIKIHEDREDAKTTSLKTDMRKLYFI